MRSDALQGERYTVAIGISRGSDDQLWFTQNNPNDVGKMCPELTTEECATSP